MPNPTSMSIAPTIICIVLSVTFFTSLAPIKEPANAAIIAAPISPYVSLGMVANLRV